MPIVRPSCARIWRVATLQNRVSCKHSNALLCCLETQAGSSRWARYDYGRFIVPMINGKRIAIVLPAYNAEKTLEATMREVPETVDTCILVDDSSTDKTVELAHALGLHDFVPDHKYG